MYGYIIRCWSGFRSVHSPSFGILHLRSTGHVRGPRYGVKRRKWQERRRRSTDILWEEIHVLLEEEYLHGYSSRGIRNCGSTSYIRKCVVISWRLFNSKFSKLNHEVFVEPHFYLFGSHKIEDWNWNLILIFPDKVKKISMHTFQF